MSTKSSILLSRHNEHWYRDYIDNSITLEIDAEHEVERCDDGGSLIITIKDGTALHTAIGEQILGHSPRNVTPVEGKHGQEKAQA